MGSKVTISVAAGASHAVRATRVATPTGQEYESVEVKADAEQEIELGDEEAITLTQGQVTPDDEKSEEE